MQVDTVKIMKYALLPGIVPRAFAFFTSGFSSIALYMAYVYQMVRLLPAGHPYLNPRNAGRYGIRHVVFEAWRHLKHSRETIDQVIIFYSLLAGIAVLLLQFVLVFAAIFMPAAHAMGAYYAYFFVTKEPTYDIAFRLLDLTFGFKDPITIFNSCAVQGTQCQLAFTPGGGYTPVGPTYSVPTQFHRSLHALFQFYNTGVLVIGFMVAMYMFTTVIAETAQSGTPFGRRFNGMWAPMRLIIAIALLTPLSFGMNGAQLLTLLVAKWGSGLATNGWAEFSTSLNHVPIQGGSGATSSLVAKPDAPSFNTLVEFTFVALTCKNAEELLNGRGLNGTEAIAAWQVYGDQRAAFTSGDFVQALSRANNGDVVIRFGVPDDTNFNRFAGHVKPICGEIVFNTKDVTQPGALKLQQDYYDMVYNLWTNAQQNTYARNVALRFLPVAERDPFAAMPDSAYLQSMVDYFENAVSTSLDAAIAEQVAADWSGNYLVLGWAGAGMWYQKIAEYTGSLFSSLYGVPAPHLYPEVMERVKVERRIQNDFVDGQERYSPVLSNGNMVEFETPRDESMALAYYYAQSLWGASLTEPSGNTFIDTVFSVFGLTGLFEMQKNRDVHPLAQLVGVGRSLVESAVTNLGLSFFSGMAGGIASMLSNQLIGSVAKAAASFVGQVALIGLSVGIILYYILPFLPFIYFFFAAGGWVKGIFEAMVGLPLWALAHIRIDGEGLPGPAGLNGYLLVFEILIRPTLIVAGLLGGIAIFTAEVQVLNDIWQLVTSNVMGFDGKDLTTNLTAGTDAGVGAVVGSIEYLRGAADQLFYTVMYAIIVYMLGIASFKLIDMIPNNILRWVGSSVSTFGDHSGDPAQKLIQYSFFGSQLAVGQLNSAIAGISSRARPGQ